MAQNSAWQKLTGTSLAKFALGFAGNLIKTVSGAVQTRNSGDTAFVDISAKDALLNNNTTGFKVTLTTSGSQAADYSLTLPVDDGSPSQVLSTDGSGVLSWISAASTADLLHVDTTSLAFGSGATVSMFTLPANAVISQVDLIVDTAFNGTPTASVGVNGGSASKYMASTDNLLSAVGRYTVWNTETASGSTEALEIAYSAGGASAGAGRVLVYYSNPA